MINSKNIQDPALLAEWRDKAGSHPFSMGAINYPLDWGWEDSCTHKDIIERVNQLGPIYVYCKESNLLIIYS
jgi:hypothetical protein